jgi:FemAB-related protein (PEP-CTERM system-associated)
VTTVWTLDGALERRWADYLAAHPHATAFHELAWRDVLTSTFKHRPHYLVAETGGRVSGVLPVVEIDSVFFGTSMVSVPFGVYGGVLADDAAIAARLADAGRALARRRRARYVELRHLHDPGLDLPTNDLYVTFIADVPPTHDGCLDRIPRKARAEVRKALGKPGLTVDVGSRDVDEFHRLFALNKRDLGSPVFPRELFRRVMEVYNERCFILRVRYEGETVAAVLSLVFKDTVMPYYSGASDRARALAASNLLYYALMEHASDRGLKKFDFGRSRRDTGPFEFKKNQGFEPTPLKYQYLLENGGSPPALNPDNPKFGLARKVFRRLPMPLATRLGAYVSARLPI